VLVSITSSSTLLTLGTTGLAKWKGPSAKTNVFLIGLVLWAFIIVGCLENDNVTDLKGARYYYGCGIPKDYIEKIIARGAIKVLPWKEFREEAWKYKFGNNTLAFYAIGEIYLQEGYTVGTLYHEIAHDYEATFGRYGHDYPCWHTEKPYGYNERVLNSFDGIELPRED